MLDQAAAGMHLHEVAEWGMNGNVSIHVAAGYSGVRHN
jgi:hypothetical protein